MSAICPAASIDWPETISLRSPATIAVARPDALRQSVRRQSRSDRPRTGSTPMSPPACQTRTLRSFERPERRAQPLVPRPDDRPRQRSAQGRPDPCPSSENDASHPLPRRSPREPILRRAKDGGPQKPPSPQGRVSARPTSAFPTARDIDPARFPSPGQRPSRRTAQPRIPRSPPRCRPPRPGASGALRAQPFPRRAACAQFDPDRARPTCELQTTVASITRKAIANLASRRALEIASARTEREMLPLLSTFDSQTRQIFCWTPPWRSRILNACSHKSGGRSTQMPRPGGQASA